MKACEGVVVLSDAEGFKHLKIMSWICHGLIGCCSLFLHQAFADLLLACTAFDVPWRQAGDVRSCVSSAL